MKPSLYLETTIPSFLVGNISPILITAGHQISTRKWWEEKRDEYRLFASQVVIGEIQRGKSTLAQERLQIVSVLPQLEVIPDVLRLSDVLQKRLALPSSAETDVLHVAITCHYAIDYLLTWNLRHIANGRVMRSLAQFHDETHTPVPTICTPEELLERMDDL
jgi:hypothetical protein